MERISVTDAARHFSDLLNRVHHQGSRFEIARGAEVIAQVVPANLPKTAKLAHLDERFAQLPKLDAEDVVAFEKDIDTLRRETISPDLKWD